MALTYIKGIHDLLIRRNRTIAVAESLTGGLLSKLLTDYSGSSKYFLLGIVAYHNKAKEKILRIPPVLLAKHGAVSEEVARRMAIRVKIIAGADIGIGITGIAGPLGGSARKAVGTVYIAVAHRKKTICSKFLFLGTRVSIRNQSVRASAALLKTLFP